VKGVSVSLRWAGECGSRRGELGGLGVAEEEEEEEGAHHGCGSCVFVAFGLF